jgi:hypothetical protein
MQAVRKSLEPMHGFGVAACAFTEVARTVPAPAAENHAG